jgi:hypothetical protein
VTDPAPPKGSVWQAANGMTVRCRVIEGGKLFIDVRTPISDEWIDNLSVPLEVFHDWVARGRAVWIEEGKAEDQEK